MAADSKDKKRKVAGEATLGPNPAKKTKKAAKEHVASTPESKVKLPKNSSNTSKQAPPIQKEINTPIPTKDDGVDGEVEDEQTIALLKGFESSEDESSVDQAEEYASGKNLPDLDIPKSKKKKLGRLEGSNPEQTGVVYIGRIPHGFYENEMRGYFGQFGDIKRVRLSRNKKTGASKHYAFIEFASSEVANIAAQTMDHYLLFGHILKVKVIPPDQVPENLWKGANRRFRKVPWSKLQKERLERGKTAEQWEKKNKAEQEKRDSKLQKLQSLGYDFKMPNLKSPKVQTNSETSKELTSMPATGSSSLVLEDNQVVGGSEFEGSKKDEKERSLSEVEHNDNENPTSKPAVNEQQVLNDGDDLNTEKARKKHKHRHKHKHNKSTKLDDTDISKDGMRDSRTDAPSGPADATIKTKEKTKRDHEKTIASNEMGSSGAGHDDSSAKKAKKHKKAKKSKEATM